MNYIKMMRSDRIKIIVSILFLLQTIYSVNSQIIFSDYHELPQLHKFNGLTFKGPVKKVEVFMTWAKFGKMFVKKKMHLPEYNLRRIINYYEDGRIINLKSPGRVAKSKISKARLTVRNTTTHYFYYNDDRQLEEIISTTDTEGNNNKKFVKYSYEDNVVSRETIFPEQSVVHTHFFHLDSINRINEIYLDYKNDTVLIDKFYYNNEFLIRKEDVDVDKIYTSNNYGYTNSGNLKYDKYVVHYGDEESLGRSYTEYYDYTIRDNYTILEREKKLESGETKISLIYLDIDEFGNIVRKATQLPNGNWRMVENRIEYW